MKLKSAVIIGLMLLIGLLAVSSVASYDFNNQIVDGLNSTSDYAQALDDAKINNKTVLLIFDQDSCYYCDLLKQDTLSDLEVQEILNNDYIVANVDINREASLAAEYQVFGTPTMVFLDGDANQIYRIEGYVPADEFLDDLKEI